GLTFAETVVEDSAAAANDGLRRLCRIGRTGRPGKADARRKIELAVNVRLVLVPQAVAQHKVRPDAPVVLSVEANISLRNLGRRIAGIDAELRSAATQPTNAVRE